jgi:hypothetical protein
MTQTGAFTMKNISAVIAVLCLLFLPTASAHAQAIRTWVSGVGDDANPCSRTAPCKTFAGAISKTAVSGEISVLDPGGFGAVTITKSISIVAEGAEGGIIGSLVNGITINITNPTDPGVVNVHGLVIEGAGNGLNGVRVLAAKEINIQNCIIRGFKSTTGAGIDVNPTANDVDVLVSNTSINNNLRGIRARSEGAGRALVMLDRVNISGVGLGVVAGANSAVRITNSVITGVGSAFTTGSNGKILSFGNNAVAGNAVPADDNPTNTIALK